MTAELVVQSVPKIPRRRSRLRLEHFVMGGAILSLIVFFLAGGALLAMVDVEKGQRAARDAEARALTA